MELYTIEGVRPDLNGAALKYNEPEGYIGSKILPVSITADKSGVIYFHKPDAIKEAQTDRVSGTAPEDELLTNDNTDYSCGEVIKRSSVAEEEVKEFGGIEKADVVGAKDAARAVATKVEGTIADLTLKTASAADYSFVPGSALLDAQAAMDAIEDYAGEITLIASRTVVKKIWKLLHEDDDAYRMIRRITGGNALVGFDQIKDLVATLLGVDRVLVGHNSVWNKNERGDRFAIGKLISDFDGLSHKYQAIFGVQKVYTPDPANPDWPFKIESIPDRKCKSNHYDATIRHANVILNAGAVKVFDLGEHSDSASASASA